MDKNLSNQFGKIYDRYVEKIYRFIYIKVSSQETAEDLTSEVFLRVWRTFQKNGQEKIKNPKAFLYKTARNLLSDYYRKRPHLKMVSIEEAKEMADPGQKIDEKEIVFSELETIQKAISQLKDDYQDVLLWYYLDNLSVEEISKILNKSENAVRVMIHRAMNNLREALGKSD
jgi:RNA polymerase sigma-70 factor (ECF subfamily)